MKNRFNHFTTTLTFLVVLLSLWQCTKPTPFGAELLDDQIADFNGDSLDLICTMERPDSVVSADRTSTFDYFICGQINDPEFGTTTVDIYSHVRPTDTAYIVNARFDSVFLVLPYAVNGFYGDTLTPQTLQVFQLAETLDFNKAYLIGDTLPVAEEIGRMENLLPRPRTIRRFLDTASTNTVKIAYLKIPLTATFGERLLKIDTSKTRVASEFHKEFKGIKITSRTNNGTGAIMGFDLNSTNCFIQLHYSPTDSTRDSTTYRLNWPSTDQQMSKFMHVEHSYATSPAGAALGMSNAEKIFLQGMGGIRLKVEFPPNAILDNILINKAELQAYAIHSDTFPMISQLVAYYEDEKKAVYYTSDVAFSLASDTYLYFGGSPKATENSKIKKYQFTLTDHFQDIVKNQTGDALKRTIFLNVNVTDNYGLLTPSRTVFYGPNHPTYPMKMRIKYTKL